MSRDEYGPVPLDDEESVAKNHLVPPHHSSYKLGVCVMIALLVALFIGFAIGQNWNGTDSYPSWPPPGEDRVLPAQAFVPQIPNKETTFDFPTTYEDTGVDGDQIWDALMPYGSGFIRVPYPRRYDMPPSKIIDDDPEEAEMYSLSITHQLHCLGVLRDVIKQYEKHSKSRFAGDGHEYHCLDYIRQSVLCAGDTTLDHADDIIIGADGTPIHVGFTGRNATHWCRDWEAIKKFAIENREGDKVGIL